MSVTAMSWALYRAPAKDPTQRLVLIHLADHAGRDGRGAFPSAQTIAADLGVDKRTVQRHLVDLEREKVIARGDQEFVSHIRADRRPVVWDLDLEVMKTVAGPDEGDGESPKSGGDRPSKRRGPTSRGDTHVAPSRSHGVTPTSPRKAERRDTRVTPSSRHGVTSDAPRGDTGGVHGVTPVSPKPSTKPTTKNSLPSVVSSHTRARDDATSTTTRTNDATSAGNELLAEHIAACRPQPPRRVTQRTGAEIDELVREGITPNRIRAGLALLRSKPHLGPALLPQLVHEAATRAALGAAPTVGRERNLDVLARARARMNGDQPDLTIIDGELA